MIRFCWMPDVFIGRNDLINFSFPFLWIVIFLSFLSWWNLKIFWIFIIIAYNYFMLFILVLIHQAFVETLTELFCHAFQWSGTYYTGPIKWQTGWVKSVETGQHLNLLCAIYMADWRVTKKRLVWFEATLDFLQIVPKGKTSSINLCPKCWQEVLSFSFRFTIQVMLSGHLQESKFWTFSFQVCPLNIKEK